MLSIWTVILASKDYIYGYILVSVMFSLMVNVLYIESSGGPALVLPGDLPVLWIVNIVYNVTVTVPLPQCLTGLLARMYPVNVQDKK